jgi:hypothetical protein
LAMLSSTDQAIAQQRMQLIAAAKSVARTIFLDADGNEDFTRTEVSFASLPQLMQQINLRTAGAFGLPATKLFGQEPAGMNATGESDIRQFYDGVAEYRQRAAVKFERLLSWILGRVVALEWPSLWEQSDKEKAETRNANAQADKVWSDLGALDPVEIGVARARDGSFGIDVDPAKKEADARAAEAAGSDAGTIEITPTVQAAIVTVNEARAALKLDPLSGEEGKMTVAELMAQAEQSAKPEPPPAPPLGQQPPPPVPGQQQPPREPLPGE